jgi:predicted nucleic acid-binding protein
MRTALEERHDIIIPPVAYYEIRRGFKRKTAPAKEKAFSIMCLQYPIGEMNIAAWERAADIYADSRLAGDNIEDSDILIAAFCIVNDYTLVTNNTRHFKDMKGLSFVDWAEDARQ